MRVIGIDTCSEVLRVSKGAVKKERQMCAIAVEFVFRMFTSYIMSLSNL